MLVLKMYTDFLKIGTKIASGNPTNGATTGPHLHLSISENGTAVDPLKYVEIPK